MRNPKAADEELKEAVKLHVVGLIFHGTPDSVHLFYAGPHLAGNSNLNIECIYRAVLHDYKRYGLLSVFHVQFDNASDNKSRWCLGFFAWLIRHGYIKEARISMMMVGHTHEDIDAIFQLISAAWKRLRAVLSPDAFVRMLQTAVPNCVVHDFLEYVHDWATFFSDCIYEDVVGINTAREFIMRQRDDGGAPPPPPPPPPTTILTNSPTAPCARSYCILVQAFVVPQTSLPHTQRREWQAGREHHRRRDHIHS